MRSPPRCGGGRRERSRCARLRCPANPHCSTSCRPTSCWTGSAFPRAPSVSLNADVTQAPALPFAYPVVVKALSAKIAHKSDVGGVVLNVHGEKELLAAIQKIRAATKTDRVLVQPMMAGLGEVLIGYRRDADVGPLVMLAAAASSPKSTATAAFVSLRSILPKRER